MRNIGKLSFALLISMIFINSTQLDLSAMECARQMALIDHGMVCSASAQHNRYLFEQYKEILPLHCIHGTWSKANATSNAVAAVIMRFNNVCIFILIASPNSHIDECVFYHTNPS